MEIRIESYIEWTEQLEVLECMLLAGCCVFFSFRDWGKSELKWYVQGSLKYLGIQERFRAVRSMSSFVVTLWRPNTSAPLVWTLLLSCVSPWQAFTTNASTSGEYSQSAHSGTSWTQDLRGDCLPSSWRFFPAHLPLCLCSTQPHDLTCLLRFILWLLEQVPKVDYAIKFREEEGSNTCWASH